MSLITRCPSCLTSFQVTQSQLAQASGWVRCGRCDQIFDGATHVVEAAVSDGPVLQSDAADTDSSAPQAADVEQVPAAAAHASSDAEVQPPMPPRGADGRVGLTLGQVSPAAQAQAGAHADPVMHRSGLNDLLDDVRPAASGSDVPEEPALDPMRVAPDPLPEVRPPDPADPSEPVVGDLAAHADAQTAQLPETPALPADASTPELPDTAEHGPAAFTAEPERAAPETEPDTEAAPATPAPVAATEPPATAPEPTLPPDAATDAGSIAVDVAPSSGAQPPAYPKPPPSAAAPSEPSFVALARRRAFWNRGPVRAVLWLLLLLLCAALAGQWAVHERNRLAAQHPRLAPALDGLCQVLGCTVAPYRRLDALAITSSSLKRLDDAAFELDVSLRNRADFAVAAPALELTLTDVFERILLRRTLKPDELGAPERIAARDASHIRRALVIDAGAGVSGVVNYKLQMFYP